MLNEISDVIKQVNIRNHCMQISTLNVHANAALQACRD